MTSSPAQKTKFAHPWGDALLLVLLFGGVPGGLPSATAASEQVAADTPASLYIQLQVAVRQHFEHHKINGFWHYIDHGQQRPSKLKPDFSSPKFYRIGDYYAVRLLFLDPNGAPRPIIFYLTRRRPSEFVIVQVDVIDEKPLENLVRNKIAQPINLDHSQRSP